VAQGGGNHTVEVAVSVTPIQSGPALFPHPAESH
jgi:hypothetical protein